MSAATLRRGALGIAMGAALAMFAADAHALDKVSVQTGWLAQAEQGGFYQAVATGIYEKYALEVTIRKGGPQVDINAPFLAGRVDFADSNAFTVFNYVKEGLPGVAVAAFFPKDPRVLLSHPGVGNDKLQDLKGKPILIATTGRQSYWQWLKAKYGFTDEQARPYTFNMAPFIADKNVTMQGLLTSEPLDLKKIGIDAVVHLLADSGFENYAGIIMASPKMIAENPDLVQRFVDATIKGWDSYLNGDPAPGNALIKRDNPDMTDEKIAYSIAAMNSNGILNSGDAKTLGLGAMTDKRWKSFYDSMVAAGAQPAGLDVTKGYTLKFINKGAGG
jgi:NitT/TauT family transport system substrate-binding protein